MTRERWKTVSVELSEPLRELDCDSGYQGVRVIFLWKNVPLGHNRFSAAQLPLSPRQLANCAARAIALASGDRLFEEGFRSALPGLPEPALADAAGALHALIGVAKPMAALRERERVSQASRPSLSLSVAVCTRNRPAELARCLASLLASSDRPDEILIVDNAPDSETTRKVVSQFPGVRYLCERRRGLSAARNAALAGARGDIVAFADDDVVVDRDWTGRMRRCFTDPKVAVATGLVLPAELDTPAQVMFEESFQFFHQGYRRRHFDGNYLTALRTKGVPVWDIGAGANMAVRRLVFEAGQQFDARLGPGVFGGCGEDSEFWYRLLTEGWSCVYEPSAFVYHYHRRELRDLRRQVRQYMQGHVAALLLQFAKHRHIGNLRRLLWVLPAEYVLLLLRLVVTGFSLDNRILLGGVLGCLSGLRFAWPRKPEQPAPISRCP
jgi:GT2 family glycosyltransferase